MLDFIRKIREYRRAEAMLKEAILFSVPSFEEAGFPDRVKFMNECIEHNECGVALETLCENLFEFGLLVDKEVWELIRQSGMILRMESMNWEQLEPLIGNRTLEDSIKDTLRGRTHSDSAGGCKLFCVNGH